MSEEYTPSPPPTDAYARFQQDITSRAQRVKDRQLEARLKHKLDPEFTFKPDLSQTRKVNYRRLREGKEREKKQRQTIDHAHNNQTTYTANIDIEKTDWHDDGYDEHGQNEIWNHVEAFREDRKKNKDGRNKSRNKSRTNMRNNKSKHAVRSSGSSGANYQENDDSYGSSRTEFYDGNDFDPIGETFSDEYEYEEDEDEDDEERRALEDEELAALERHDDFEKRLDDIFERTINRRQRREVQRKHRLKKQRDADDRDAMRAAGIGPKDSHEFLAAQQLKQQQHRQHLLLQQQSRRQRASNAGNNEDTVYLSKYGYGAATGTGGVSGVGGVSGIGGMGDIVSGEMQHVDQLRIEKLVRSGQRRAEVIQQLEFDLLRAELSSSLENVGNTLHQIEERELTRSMKETSMQATQKWWTKEELQQMERRKESTWEEDQKIDPSLSLAQSESPRQQHLMHARSQLQHLKSRKPQKSYRARDAAKQKQISARSARGRHEKYGSGKATLVVHNDDTRRMGKGRQWQVDIDRPRGKHRKR